MKALERLEQKYTKKRALPATECYFEESKDSKGTKNFVIWFDYVNEMGRKSTTPKIILNTDIIKALGKYWKERRLI